MRSCWLRFGQALVALVLAGGAAGGERAARRVRARVGRLAGQGRKLVPQRNGEIQPGPEQARENGDAVGHLGGHAEVVSDEDEGAADLVAQVTHQGQDLRLDRHIQGGGRFIGDHQVRVPGDGHRQHHALPEAAGQLVGVGAHPPGRLGNADQVQQAHRLAC